METPLKNIFEGKKVLITGHTGFKGAWLTQILLLQGADIVGVSLSPHTKPNLFETLNLKQEIKHYLCDIRNYDELEAIFVKEKPEIVFHLAAQAIVRQSYDTPQETFATNTLGTVNVLEAIRNIEIVKTAIMVTTDKVYENREDKRLYKETDRLGGNDPYSASKSSAENAIHAYRNSFFPVDEYNSRHNTLIASVRSGNVIGGGDWAEDRIIPDVIRSIFEKGSPVVLRNPNAVRPWQHVLEPLSGYLLLAQRMCEGEKGCAGAWNFGPSKEDHVSVKNLVEWSIQYAEGGSIKQLKSNDDKEQKKESTILMLDTQKAREKLGWRQKYNAQEAVKETIEWYKVFCKDTDIKNYTINQIDTYLNK